MTATVTGILQTANRRGKLVPYLKFASAWQGPWGGWFVGGDVAPTDIRKWDLRTGNIDGRRFSAAPSGNTMCGVTLIDELEAIATTAAKD